MRQGRIVVLVEVNLDLAENADIDSIAKSLYFSGLLTEDILSAEVKTTRSILITKEG